MRKIDKDEIKFRLLQYPELFSRVIVSGIDIDKLLKTTAFVVGAGGLGVLVAEMLARTGIGKLILVDKDVVSEENFNRLGYNREDIGKNKALALKEKLEKLRNTKDIPEKFHLEIEAYDANIIAWDNLEKLISKSDVVFMCLDNEEARLEVNYYAMQHKKPIIDGATSVTALSGTVLTILPCETPCYECHHSPDAKVALDNYERVGGCDASIAHVMATLAAIQVDQGIKVILGEKEGLYHIIRINFDGEVSIAKIPIEGSKPREGCFVHNKFCGKHSG